MTLPENNLNEELIEDEPKNNPGDNASFDEAADGWGWRREHRPSPVADNGPEPFRRTSRAIADTLDDIASGRSIGEYPAVDAIIARQPRRAGPGDICTPERCTHRQRSHQEPYQGLSPAFDRRPIDDVYPRMSERVAVLEHVTKDLDREFENHKTESIRASAAYATKEELQNLEVWINRDVLPKIDKHQLKNALLITSLIVSGIYGVIMTVLKIIEMRGVSL